MSRITMHPRVLIVQKAGLELAEAFIEISKKYELTPIEEAAILSGRVGEALKYAIRYERHRNYEKRGGEE
jgi:hypothetical protein